MDKCGPQANTTIQTRLSQYKEIGELVTKEGDVT